MSDRRSTSKAIVSQLPGNLRRLCSSHKMLSSEKEPVSGDETMPELPNELVCEILTWLPGKQIGRCRCVCKAWRTMIGTRPFRETYRERQRGLVFYLSTVINRDDGKLADRHKFFHCPLRRLKEPPEEFRPLPVIDTEVIIMGAVMGVVCSRPVYLTQLVDGLLCVGECVGNDVESGEDYRLTLHNIGTGETMKLQDPLTCYSKKSTYHLGYDGTSGEYKLLRLIFGSRDPIQRAHILSLRGSHISTWRVVDNGLQFADIDFLSEVRQCGDDGVVCWTHYLLKSLWEHLLCFDFSKERFQFVELPREEGIYIRFLGLTRFNGSLALWLREKYGKTCCYLLRDEEEEGEKWSRRSGEVSRYFEEIESSVVASEKFPDSSPSSNSHILVMSLDPDSENQLSLVYSYCRGEEEVFFVGELPDGFVYRYYNYPRHYWQSCSDPYPKVHCLLDSNHLHLSLDHILAPASATMS